jgi:hypothetical protein
MEQSIDRFDQYQHDPSDLVPEPPPDHAIDDERAATGENIDPDDWGVSDWEAEWGSNPFGEYHR